MRPKSHTIYYLAYTTSRRLKKRPILLTAFLLSLAACSQNFTVSVNDQAVFDPTGRLFTGQLADPDLQGCVNIALRLQGAESAEKLKVLACSHSEVETLDNITQLSQLRFLELGNNSIRDISPLAGLSFLSGLNLMNNSITDISPLLNISTLVSVNLVGNNSIPCSQLQSLEQKLGNNLEAPEACD